MAKERLTRVNGKVVRPVGKGSTEQMLPSRHAMDEITGGDPAQRSMSNYAKKTPGVGSETPSILTMGGFSPK